MMHFYKGIMDIGEVNKNAPGPMAPNYQLLTRKGYQYVGPEVSCGWWVGCDEERTCMHYLFNRAGRKVFSSG